MNMTTAMYVDMESTINYIIMMSDITCMCVDVYSVFVHYVVISAYNIYKRTGGFSSSRG